MLKPAKNPDTVDDSDSGIDPSGFSAFEDIEIQLQIDGCDKEITVNLRSVNKLNLMAGPYSKHEAAQWIITDTASSLTETPKSETPESVSSSSEAIHMTSKSKRSANN